jgi:hypothetical protein
MCSDRSQGWPDFKGQRPVLRWAAAGFRVFVLTAGAPLPGIQACAYLSRCGIQPRPAGRIAWQGKSFRSLPIPVKYMRFAMTARFFGSAERLDPRDATKPKQKPGFIHVDDEPGG